MSFLELEKRKLFLNIMLNTKRRREGEDILAFGGEEKIMSLWEKEREKRKKNEDLRGGDKKLQRKREEEVERNRGGRRKRNGKEREEGRLSGYKLNIIDGFNQQIKILW